MNDDLRNMVWRGHYLGWGPADVLLHVPVDRPLMDANPQVSIFAPYYRERVVIARRRERVPAARDAGRSCGGEPVAVAGQSLAGWLLIGADGGALRDSLSTHWKRRRRGRARRCARRGGGGRRAWLRSWSRCCAATRASRSRRCRRRARRATAGRSGCAVKRDATDLAQALQQRDAVAAAQASWLRQFELRAVAWQLT